MKNLSARNRKITERPAVAIDKITPPTTSQCNLTNNQEDSSKLFDSYSPSSPSSSPFWPVNKWKLWHYGQNNKEESMKIEINYLSVSKNFMFSHSYSAFVTSSRNFHPTSHSWTMDIKNNLHLSCCSKRNFSHTTRLMLLFVHDDMTESIWGNR